jgi:hypothetical protein
MHEKTLVLRTQDGFRLYYDDRRDVYIETEPPSESGGTCETFTPMTVAELFEYVTDIPGPVIEYLNFDFLDRLRVLERSDGVAIQ